MKLFTTITILLISINLNAKNKTFKGYIINTEGQRVEGKIKTKNVTVDQMKITFIASDDVKSTYKPKDIIGYGYEFQGENEFGEATFVWRHYKSKTAQSFAPKAFASKEVFMEIMEEGKVTLYDYYVETPSDIENPYKRFFYVEREGSDDFKEISIDNYVEITTHYLKDYEELSKKIGTTNHRFRHLWKVVRLYNDWSEMQEMNSRMADKKEEGKEKYSETIPF